MRWLLVVGMLLPLTAFAAESYGKLPLAFEPNLGQTDSQVRFVVRGGGMTAFFTDTETAMVLGRSEQAVVRMKLTGADQPRRVIGLEKLPGISNYFIGNDPRKWRTDVPHYGRIEYQGVYPGVDLVWYGNQRQLEYDFVVAAGADPKQIQVAYEGVESVKVEAGGELVLRTALGEVRQQQPRVYQEIGGKRVGVAARYAITARNRVRFELAKYDRKRALRIDPVVLVYSTYLGGTGWDQADAIAVDAAGSAYVTGATQSTNFPTQSAYQTTYQGGDYDVFVTKLAPAGNALVYSTYLGGNDWDWGYGIAVDAAGSAYLTGYTRLTNFPIHLAYQATNQLGYGDAFVTKLSPAGNALIYSTYLGGSWDDSGSGIAVDAAGSAYVAGSTISPNFPTQSPYQAAHQGDSDVFVTKLTPAGNALVYSTFLGGRGRDYGYAIAVDGAGSAYVTGMTSSWNFPAESPYQTTFHGSTDLGGTGWDFGYAIAVDTAGSAYVTGYTQSADFPTQSAFQAMLRGFQNAFVTKLSPSGKALVYSTYLGGSEAESGNGIAADGAGSAYVTGWTGSTNFPTQSAYQATEQGNSDAFMTKLTPTGDALSYSTYLGGSFGEGGRAIAVDGTGSAYVTGSTESSNFPTRSPYQATHQGSSVGFVTKLALGSSGLTASQFVPISPCRVADTRLAAGPFGGPAFAGNSSRDFAIPAGSCGIPSSALAYSFNVTAVPSGPLLYLSMWPTGDTLPVVSTLNALDGRWTANAAIVPAGTNGSVSVFASDATNVVLDLNGYFVPAATSGALSFYPLTPCRVTDTRSGAPIAAGGTRTVAVRSSACSVPAAAVAYSLNFTALPQGPLGWITTWPTGAAMPTASTLNAPTGTITANAAILPAGTNGSVDVYASDATDLLVDINGYFAPPGTGGLSFYTLTPCRVADTRNANGPFGGPALTGTRDYAVPASACGVPNGAQAYSLNATVWPAAGFLNWLTLWPTGGAMPLVSTLNSWDGRLVANAAIVPTTTGSISAYTSDLTQFFFDINGYFAP